MDGSSFDTLTRLLDAPSARRGVLPGIAALALGLSGKHPRVATARKRKQKLKRNQFGCVDVGKPCRGKNGNCCSGVCDGKKPKQGKSDRSRCRARNVLGCAAGADSCTQGNVFCGTNGICLQTTGKAAFCGAGNQCFDCEKDVDCEALYGPGAACTVCPAECPSGKHTLCTGLAV